MCMNSSACVTICRAVWMEALQLERITSVMFITGGQEGMGLVFRCAWVLGVLFEQGQTILHQQSFVQYYYIDSTL